MRIPHSVLMSMTIGLIALGVQQQASAQSYLSPNPPRTSVDDRFRLEVDLLYGTYDTQIQLNEVVNVNGFDVVTPGTVVSAEDDFGLAKAKFLGQVELTLLPGKHHMVRFSGLSMRRSGSQTLTQDIAWENDDFLAGERVDSHLDLSLLGLTYGYLPLRSDRYELGLSFGLQILSVSANAEVRSRLIRESESADGPLPMWGIEGRYEFTRRWSVDLRAQYFGLTMIDTIASIANALGADTDSLQTELQNKTGTIIDGRIALRWRQNQHLVYGLGYRYFDLDVQSPDSDPGGIVTLNLSGPILFVQASL